MISEPSGAQDASYTAPAEHTTAAAIGKQYQHEFSSSQDGDKACTRTSDGDLSSGDYAQGSKALGDHITPRSLQIDFHHPLEDWLGRKPFRRLLGYLSKPRPSGKTTLENIIESYGESGEPRTEASGSSGSSESTQDRSIPFVVRKDDRSLPFAARWWRRIKYWPFHRFITAMRGKTDMATFRKKLSENRPTIRGIVIVARSIAEFGLTQPQKFSAPLFAVWNFTNQCNLACKHCYQDSEHKVIEGELTLEEKLALVDQMGKAYLPMLALSGGEPTISKDLIPVIERARSYGMHVTIATNGTTMTPEFAARLAAAGLRYVEISLDSVDPARHDAFRGTPGLWKRTVAGARVVKNTPGLRLGIAMCVHQGNFHEVPDMLRFAEEDLGAECFAHFNFIPVGRGLKMVNGDITPRQREQLLAILNEKMQTGSKKPGSMGIISTAPQLGRVCLAGAAIDGKAACSHAGSGSGVKARVVAKYLGGCGAGRTYICVEPNGDITPCVYIPQRVMGNVRKAPLMDIYRNSVFWEVLNDRSHRLHHCEVCAFKNYCGGCRARADAYFGQLHAGDPGCIFNNKHWDKLVADGIAVMGGDPDGLAAQTPPQDVQLSRTRHGPA